MKSYVSIKMSQDINDEEVKEMLKLLNSPELLESTKNLYKTVMYDIITNSGKLQSEGERVKIEVDVGMEDEG